MSLVWPCLDLRIINKKQPTKKKFCQNAPRFNPTGHHEFFTFRANNFQLSNSNSLLLSTNFDDRFFMMPTIFFWKQIPRSKSKIHICLRLFKIGNYLKLNFGANLWANGTHPIIWDPLISLQGVDTQTLAMVDDVYKRILKRAIKFATLQSKPFTSEIFFNQPQIIRQPSTNHFELLYLLD